MKELNVEKYKNGSKMSYLREEEKQDWLTVAESVRGMENNIQDISSNASDEIKQLEFKLDARITKIGLDLEEDIKVLNAKLDTTIDVLGAELLKMRKMVWGAFALATLALLLSLVI